MSSFKVLKVEGTDASYFDRQERIEWWSQEKIRKASVMVLGAGAIGNELLKNLALLGFGDILVADFDEVSDSNLSRTVLFRKSDTGERKARVAAERTKQLCLREDTSIEWFDGDIVWDLGTGAYRDVDIVFGCLDNVETRIAANKQCWLADTPWIDAGISKLAAHVKVYQPPSPPCYQCTASRQQLMAARQRYSCDNFKKKYYSSGKVPTVQIASAFVAAVQAQEGVKLLCGQEPTEKKIHYQGKNNDFFLMGQRPDSECPVCSLSYPEITKLELDQHVTLRSFLNKISQKEFSGAGATLDFRGDRTFVVSACCRSCERPIELMRPSFRIYDADVICNFCRGGGRQVDQLSEEVETEKELLYQFSLDQTDSEILNLTLGQIGVPSSHILTVRSKNGCEKHYEIGGTPASGRV